MIGAQLERLLKIADRFSGASFARCQLAEVVPGIRQSVGITRAKFERALKTEVTHITCGVGCTKNI